MYNKRNHAKVDVYRVKLNSKYNSFCIGPDLINEAKLKFVYEDENGDTIEKIVPNKYFVPKIGRTIRPKNQNGGYFYVLPLSIIKNWKPELDDLTKATHEMLEKNNIQSLPGTPGPWLCVDKDGTELIFSSRPIRDPNRNSYWTMCTVHAPKEEVIELPKGTIQKIIGKNLTWKNEPYKL